MDYKTADEILKSPRWEIKFGAEARRRKNVFEQIVWMESKAGSRKDLPVGFHEVWFALAEELRRFADLQEHAAMRDLHENRKKSWQQVADALGLKKTRQAISQRWDRLSETFTTDEVDSARDRRQRLRGIETP